MYKNVFRAGIVAYLLLLLMAMLFYKERIIFMDTTLFTFNMLRKDSFSLEHYRFIAVFTELLPVLASKLGVGLKGIMLAYSFGFWVCFFICYLLCGFVFKKYHYAIGVLLVNTILVTDIFYWPISELPLGLCLLLTIMAFLEGRSVTQLKPFNYLLLVVFMATLAFAHPLMMFPAAFGLLFLLVSTRDRSQRVSVVIAGGLFVMGVATKHIFFKEDYDSGAMSSIVNFKYLFPNYFRIESNRTLFWAFFTKYYWLPVCTIIITIYYTTSKSWMKLSLFLAFLGGYTLLINVCYHYADMSGFYMENLYQPLAAILAIPLLTDVLPVAKRLQLAYAMIGLIVLTGLYRIFHVKQKYTGRLAWYRQYIDNNMDRKQMVHISKLPIDKVVMPWPSPYEFWMLSTLEKGKSASIIFYDDNNNPEWARFERKSVATTWGAFPYEELNPRYFKFSDTTKAYELIR
jgi:hypothetical protein